MPEIHELLQRAAQQPTRPPNVAVLWRRGRQRRRRRQVLGTAIVLGCLLAVAGTLAFIAEGNDRQSLDVIAPPTETAIPTTTMQPASTTASPPSSAAPTTDRLSNAASGSTRPIDQVSISVMNGSGFCGVAANYRAFVMATGYQSVFAENAPSIVATSTIVFFDGFAADASVLATRLKMPISATLDERTAAWLERAGANIGVVLGQDALSYVAKPEQCGGSGELGSNGSIVTTTRRPLG